MTTPNSLGAGFAFPLQINGRGGVQQARDVAKVRASVLVLLGTRQGERVMRPKFGCNLGSLVFSPNNPAVASLARHYVTEGLSEGEPRIVLDGVAVENDHRHGRLLIHVRYRLRSTNEPDNLVYPFYLQPQREEQQSWRGD